MMMVVRAVETSLFVTGLARKGDDPEAVRRLAVALSEHRFVEYGVVGATLYHFCAPGLLRGSRGPITDAANNYLVTLERYPEYQWVQGFDTTVDLRTDLVRAIGTEIAALRDPMECVDGIADFVTWLTFSRHDLRPLRAEDVGRILSESR